MKLEGDQFSFKKILFSIFLIIPFIRKNYILILIGSFIGLLLGLYIEIYKNNNIFYKSDIVFIMDSEAGSTGGALSELASSFGLSGNFGGNNTLFSGENFKELLKTKAIFRRALLKKVIWNGKEEIFANIFLKKSRINEFEWSSLPEDFYIHRFKSSELKDLNLQDRNVLDMIYLHLKEKTFLVAENQKSSFLKLSVETRNDTLSYVWSKLYYSHFNMKKYTQEVKYDSCDLNIYHLNHGLMINRQYNSINMIICDLIIKLNIRTIDEILVRRVDNILEYNPKYLTLFNSTMLNYFKKRNDDE